MLIRRTALAAAVATAAFGLLAAGPAFADYAKPPEHLLKVLKAPPPPMPSVDPTGQRLLLTTAQTYPSISRVAQPYLKLAGVRLEPKNRSRHDTQGGYGIPACVADFTLVDIDSRRHTPVALPQGCAGNAQWSADGQRFVFQNAVDTSVQLWVGDAATGQVKQIPGVQLNPIFGYTVQWLGGSQNLLVKLVPANQGAAPSNEDGAAGPDIQESLGAKGESSTYESRDTLTSVHDEKLFAYYGQSQLAVVDAKAGSVRPIGAPALYNDVTAAPDGVHVLTETLKAPFSHAVTYQRFANDVAVLDLGSGRSTPVASLPLADRVPVHGVPEGPRDFDWRSTDPATLVYAEALDKGDWKVSVPHRDRVLMLKAPFTGTPVEIARTAQRFEGIAWSADPAVSFLYENDENRHWRQTRIVDVDRPGQEGRLLWDLSSDELYGDPGNLVFTRLPNGASVVRQDGNHVFLRGQGASPQGDRPFLDRLDLGSLKSERLFRSAADAYEQVLGFAGTTGRVLTWHQSVTDAPNAFIRTLGERDAAAAKGEAAFASTPAALTQLTDPTPEVRQIQKRLVTYKRADGVDLSFTLYTPPGYKEGQRVPAILYAYPADFANAAQAGQVSGSQQTFTRLAPYRLMLLAGYAIIDNASFPIVGDPKTAYDTYLEQLEADARAAVDKAVDMGVVDRNRIGVTGHSHGGLMTANLIAHTDLFKAGVATSGSYNKTFTPFGFQNERRSVWQAQDVYLKASPFFYADRIKLPLLLVHGEDDANPGTEPFQSRKLFQAIRGNGGTTRLVMLPHEPHWYTALESNEQLVSEMLNWFDTYVKNAPAGKH
ncbi:MULTISPECIES: prolyl oligopeptidase family serine peptidase [Stenotrophomonas]|jgi:dipeptidyl aminopeptidase/acylaminoacyl peptidase|uniref:S9 family peptidase n=1 Tax=Stenotrophomonas TaxID=40323 RepID=UPI0002EC8390|nr:MULTISPECIES: prolyl oligopeptidase family serine peptidase [Stenotrophomonas]MBD3827553.1 S9 family peptidase [Stenotrophomonas sp.]HBS62023.1 S9 family peptidase [Stenotrophomonas sp.]